jgi:molecular chaperone DnaK
MIAGIDLGTTFSLISYLQADGKPALAPDAHFKQVSNTASSVLLGNGTAMVGYLAEASLEQQPNAHLLRFFKRDMGSTQPFAFDTSGKSWHPESLSALIIRKLRNDVEAQAGRLLQNVVITIPAHFNDAQRKATRYAAAMADVPLLGLVEEPVAAALHYGIQAEAEREQILFVYDFGGGTFDATVMTLTQQGVYVLSKEGHSELGGIDLDKVVMSRIAQAIEASLGAAFNWSPLATLQLRREAEQVKISLSTSAFFKKRVTIGDFSEEILFNRREFETAIEDNIQKTLEISRKCIVSAGLTPKDVDCFLLVGGSSMIPCIKQRLSEGLQVPIDAIKQHEPMRAVAFGAALFAAQLSGEAEAFNLPPEFRGVSGYHLGIRTFDAQTKTPSVDTVIRKNSPLPSRAVRQYYTHNATQTHIHLELMQFLDKPNEAFSIGSVDIGPIQQPKINYIIEVVMEYLADGTVAIRAFDPQTGFDIAKTFTSRFDDVQTPFILQQQELVRQTIIN